MKVARDRLGEGQSSNVRVGCFAGVRVTRTRTTASILYTGLGLLDGPLCVLPEPRGPRVGGGTGGWFCVLSFFGK